jgi:hypothetical protein
VPNPLTYALLLARLFFGFEIAAAGERSQLPRGAHALHKAVTCGWPDRSGWNSS